MKSKTNSQLLSIKSKNVESNSKNNSKSKKKYESKEELPKYGNQHKNSLKKEHSPIKVIEDIDLEPETEDTDETVFMPNFSKNYDELINGIKNVSTHKNLNTIKLDLDLEKASKPNHKSAMETNVPSKAVENLVTSIQKEEKNLNKLKDLTNIEEIRDFYEYTENCLKMISTLRMPCEDEIESMKIDLPLYMTKKKKLAIFDLDETLIHCELKQQKLAEKIITIKLPNGDKTKVGLNIRPFIIQSLTEIEKKYHLIIYTASDKSYADSVLDFIDPMKEFFKVRLYRHNCVKIKSENGNVYIKDLRIIRNVPLKNMLIIDNSVLSFAFHLDNGIPILPFYSNKLDDELLFLKDYLIQLEKSEDLREDISKSFNLKKLMLETMESDNNEYTPSEESGNSSEKSPLVIEREKILVDLELNKKEALFLETPKLKENLEDKLNKPVRKHSKFQSGLAETLHHAHKNITNSYLGKEMKKISKNSDKSPDQNIDY